MSTKRVRAMAAAAAAAVLFCLPACTQPAETDEAGELSQIAEQKIETDPAAALAAIDKAIAIEDAAYRRYDRAMMLKKLGRKAEATAELERAHAMDPKDADISFDLAYSYREAGLNDKAAEMFADGYRNDPSHHEVLEDWGYALKDAGRREEAAQKFRQAIDSRSLQPQKTQDERDKLERRMWNNRREVGMLEKDWYVDGYYVFRSPNTTSASSVVDRGNGLIGSMAGLEAGWRPLGGTKLEVFGRSYVAFEGDSLKFDGDTVQAAVGVRVRPVEDVDFSLAAEHLFGVGNDTRDAWLVRAAYFWGDGVEFDPVSPSWNYTTFYGEAAYIPGDNHYFSLYSEAIQGWRFKLAPYWALTPHVVVLATRVDDGGSTHHLVEAGPGIMLTRLLCYDEYSIPDSQVSLSLQHRFVLSDNVASRDATVLSLVLYL